MAINLIQRRAIWEAHGRRCAYCREPLLFRDLEIDHIVPRDSFEHQGRWQTIRESQGLSAEFDPEGYENLCAACAACNARKRAEMLAPGRLGIELTLARKLAVQIRDSVRLLTVEDQRDRIRLAIATGIASGQIDASEIEQLSAESRQERGFFELSPGAWLFKDQSIGDLSLANFETYLDTAVTLYDGSVGLELRCPEQGTTRVNSLREFKLASEAGCYADSTLAMDIAYQYFARPLALLNILRAARYAERSFIRTPYLGLADLELLPATLLWVTEEITSDPAFSGQRNALRGLTVKDMLGRGAVVAGVGTRMLAVHYEGGRTFLVEMLRADIDNDGTEELVVHRGCGPLQGTFRAASLVGLTRRNDSSIFEEVELPS